MRNETLISIQRNLPEEFVRILMLAQFYAPIIGGEERHVQDLSREIAKNGHDVAVATLSLRGFAPFEVDQGVGIYRVDSTTQRASWLYSQSERSHVPPLPDPELAWALSRIMDQVEPDIVHAHNWMVYSFLPLKKWYGTPLVLSLHDYSLSCVQKRFMNIDALCSGPAFSKCLKCAVHHYGTVKGGATALTHRITSPFVRSAVDIFLPVSQSTAIRNGLLENRLPFRIVPNFVPDDLGSIQKDADDYVSRLPDEGYLLFVGDLSRDKGVDVLLRAYAGIENAPPLVLIGRKCLDTPQEIPGNIFLMDSWPHRAVMEAWRRSSIALVPSICPETFGIVVIEAMTMGRPVIASRIGGLSDIVVDGETGFLVPPGDHSALRDAIQRLLLDPALRERMGQESMQRAANFRASAVVPQIEEVYRDLLDHKKDETWQGAKASLTSGYTENQLTVAAKHLNQSDEAQLFPKSVQLQAVEEMRGLLSKLKKTDIKFTEWRLLPEIAFLESLGLLLIAQAYVGARALTGSAEFFFWIGLALLIMPVAARLASAEVSRRERMALIILLGMIFYLVKFMHSPLGFTFPDEFSNIRNVREILQSHRLFMENPELPVMSFYPGLPTITSTLVSLSGLSIFQAGMLVIGAARLILFLALFLLYEQVSGSARVGSIATLLYMANPNFLFYTAEYSYESLALPLAILVLYAVVRREMRGEHRIGLTVIALLGLMTVVITHHMTSYALTAFLCLMTVIVLVRSRGKRRGPWDLALVALLATSFWLTFIASYTVNYLSPVFGRAVRSVFRLTIGEESSRQLFRSSSTEYISPLWEQFTAFGAVILISIGMPFGWLEIWRRHHKKVFSLFLGAIALAYLPMQLLRFTSAGWETANRSSEFLFIGVAFVLALSVERYWLSGRSGWSTNLGFVAFVVILIFGGFIAGWPPQARLPRPYIVATGSHMIEPQSITVAKWTREYLGPDNRFATGKVGAKLLNAYGEQDPFTGGAYGIKDMLFSSQVGSSERDIIQGAGIRYILSDRLLVSWDHMIGLYFFNHEKSPARELIGSPTFEKFDGLENVDRILDSGDIVIYDVGVYLEESIDSSQSDKQTYPPAAEVTPALKRLTGWPGSGARDESSTAFSWEEGILMPAPTPKATQANAVDVLSNCNEPIPPRWVPYTVKPGDTLYELTGERGSTPAEIRRVNCLKGKILLIDLVIWLPPLARPHLPP